MKAVPSADRNAAGRILLVDDEESVLHLTRYFLRKLGYEVTSFSDPQEALSHIEKNPKEFVGMITDFSMPQMSGSELSNRIHALCPNLPVILTTGYILPQHEQTEERLGVRCLLSKPYTMEELNQSLLVALSGVSRLE